MITIVALDPGLRQTGVVKLGPGEHDVMAATWENARVRSWLAENRSPPWWMLAVEYMRPRGMPTSQEEIDTAVELGRMIEAWSGPFEKVSRIQAKMYVCGRANATDANIRAGLIDLFGGKAVAIGGVKCPACKGRGVRGRGKLQCESCAGSAFQFRPGPLHKVKGDEWASLAVAVTARARLTGERSG